MSDYSSTTIDLPAAGGNVQARITLGPIETDSEFGSWRNATVTIGTHSWRVGGVHILDADDAAEHNRQHGLQPEAYPHMDWPGAAVAGEFQAYEIGPYHGRGDVRPTNYDECGEIQGLLAHLGYAEPTAEAWASVADVITDAVYRLASGSDDE